MIAFNNILIHKKIIFIVILYDIKLIFEKITLKNVFIS